MVKYEKTPLFVLIADLGIDFESYPEGFRRGTFVRRVVVTRDLTPEELEQIPEKHRPQGPVERNDMRVISMPPFNKVRNRVEVIFDGAAPQNA